jgi:hypothetical protein
LVTVSVYVVVAVNVPVFAAAPLVTAPTLLTVPVPPLNTAVSVVEVPVVIVAAAGAKLVIAGAASTEIVKPLLVALTPCASVTLMVKV